MELARVPAINESSGISGEIHYTTRPENAHFSPQNRYSLLKLPEGRHHATSGGSRRDALRSQVL